MWKKIFKWIYFLWTERKGGFGISYCGIQGTNPKNLMCFYFEVTRQFMYLNIKKRNTYHKDMLGFICLVWPSSLFAWSAIDISQPVSYICEWWSAIRISWPALFHQLPPFRITKFWNRWSESVLQDSPLNPKWFVRVRDLE